MRNISFILLFLCFGFVNISAQKTDTPKSFPKMITVGILNGKAKILPKPTYPKKAELAGIGGEVKIEVIIDEKGDVISAKGIAGHPLLQAVSVQSAKQAKFGATTLSGIAVSVKGTIVYNFNPPANISNKLETELMNASIKGEIAKVKDLVSRGVNVNAKDDKGTSPLMFASSNGHLPIVKFLLSKAAVIDAKDNNGFTALASSVVKEKIAVAKFLISQGSDVNIRSNDGITLLMITKSLLFAKLLIDNGADVNYRGNNGLTLLMIADNLMITDKPSLAQLLIDKGADVNAKNYDNGYTVLFYVKSVSVAQTLVANGADVNISNSKGWTPLINASFLGRAEIVKFLVSKGANINAVDNAGNSALRWAKIMKKDDVVKILEDAQK